MQEQAYVELYKELVRSKVAVELDKDLCPLLSPHSKREALTKTASQYLPLREAHLYMGRRLSMLSMDESVELRVGSLMRILGLGEGIDVGGGGVLPALRTGGGCRAPLGCGGTAQ